MKQELERIWREKPCAYPMNVAGWLSVEACQKLSPNIQHRYVTDLLRSVKGKRYTYWRRKLIKWSK